MVEDYGPDAILGDGTGDLTPVYVLLDIRGRAVVAVQRGTYERHRAPRDLEALLGEAIETVTDVRCTPIEPGAFAPAA